MSVATVEGYQLSPQQRRVWQLKHKLPGRIRCTVLLKGNITISELGLAFQRVLDRHEILRTTFCAVPGMSMPLQVIGNAPTTWLDYASLPYLEEHTSQQDFKELLPSSEESAPHQDMRSPAIAKLYQLGQDRHLLFLDVPALWLDHQGIECLINELAGCYQADDLTEMEEPVQYATVAQWLNELLDAPEEADGRAYWRDRLSSERTCVPFSSTPSAKEVFLPQHLRTVITPAVIEKITAFTGGSEIALRAFLLACLNVLLWRLTEREDIVIGTAFDGRTDPELLRVPGLLTRYLPTLAHLESGKTYAEIWEQVSNVLQEAEEWQDCFDWSLTPQVSEQGAMTDYFPICFEFQHTGEERVTGHLAWTLIDSRVYNDLFDLRLSCCPTKTGLIVDFYYNSAVLSHIHVERLAAYFAKLLQEAALRPGTDIAYLNFLTSSEEHTLLHDFAQEKQGTLRYGNLAQAFEEQVARTPHNLACALQGHSLTYTKLNMQANKLAHRLKRSGVTAETRVVLCTERSLETLIGLLGIIKSGGVCVPLDPAYPEDRRTFILKDCQATTIVTQEKLASLFSIHGIEVTCVDEEHTELRMEENLSPSIAPEQLAYVIYTSGSTGQPKGVGVSHQAALNHFVGMQEEFKLSQQDRVLQFASLSFDVSLEQIFPALFCGATVIMRGPTAWSVEELEQAITEQELTVVNLTPAYWQQWLHEMSAEAVRHSKLRLVIVGGEAMTSESLDQWRKTPLATRCLLNAYGPTEAVITALVCEASAHHETYRGVTVPIGRPLANRETYILDKRGQMTAIGVPGELYLGGTLLARGYLNRPDLTAERFVPHPFSSGMGERLYRTGDLVRYLPEGTIEYLGRVDQQVKIRGFRIEPGEIEVVLQQHPGIRTTIVIVREDHPGEKRLVAYVVLQQQHVVTVADLRAFLKSRLPEYMIPSAFVSLESLPLTVNGKVDRRALPAPDTSRPELEEPFVAPRTPVEETLARIWCEVLTLKQVGIHDNFFTLGGHSLVATQIIARIRTEFQVDVPVHLLFQEPTIARLADKITEVKEASGGLAIPAITRQRRDGR